MGKLRGSIVADKLKYLPLDFIVQFLEAGKQGTEVLIMSLEKQTISDNIFGPIEDIVLLGGGELLRLICLWARSEGVPIKIITSPRHSDETLDSLSLSDFLDKNNIPYIVVDRISNMEVKDFIGKSNNTFYLSLGAAWIFSAKIISNYFNNLLFNLHGTRLPQNRGGGGASWQVLTGNRFGFCVLHFVDEGVDTGDIVQFDEFIYPPTLRKPIDYSNYYTEKNFKFVMDFIKKYRTDCPPLSPFKQTEYFSSYWPRLNTDMNGWIDWSLETSEIERFICAFDEPYDGAQTILNNNVVRLKSASINREDGVFHSYQTGIIYRKGKHWLCVCANNCSIIIEEIYDADGNDIFDSVSVGDRFATPFEKLESSKRRPIYLPNGLKDPLISGRGAL